MADLSKIRENYQKTKNGTNSANKSSDLTKYFNPSLEEKEDNKTYTIRICPTDGDPFEEGHFHELEIPNFKTGKKEKKKIYCPKRNDGDECVICNLRDELISQGKEDDAKAYYSRKYYILKVIDRDNQKDGVKFYRFPHNSKGEGVYDKILPLFEKKGDLTEDTGEEGRDIEMTVSWIKGGNSKYPGVLNVGVSDKTPLYGKDFPSELTKEKLYEEIKTLTWKNIFTKKPKEYLLLVLKGKVPVYDKEEKKYISKEEYEAKKVSSKKDDISKEVDNDDLDEDDNETSDDLPF